MIAQVQVAIIVRGPFPQGRSESWKDWKWGQKAARTSSFRIPLVGVGEKPWNIESEAWKLVI